MDVKDFVLDIPEKIYLIATYWGYPFGGGEQFMYQTMKWMSKQYNCVWISFFSFEHKNEHPKLQKRNTDYGLLIDVPGGLNDENLIFWINLLNPVFIHHQGVKRLDFLKICNSLNVPFITGFHFWHDAIILSEKTENELILQNKNLHLPNPNLKKIITNSDAVYCCSEFMSQVISDISMYKLSPIPCIPEESHFLGKKWDLNNKYVTMINIHEKKGGKIFLELVKNLKNIPFLGVQTEPLSEKLDNEILKACEGTESRIITRQENVKKIYEQTKILLVTSIVDETFCRVALEGIGNEIPIITTGRGNIPNIVGNAAKILDPEDDWISEVNKLYFDDETLKSMSEKSKLQYCNFSETKSQDLFISMSQKILEKRRKNIMIICPWYDQGLGIQCRRYSDSLMTLGYNIFIFSFLPYYAENPKHILQKDQNEWSNYNVYYSSNNREQITNEEIYNFVIENRIGQCLIPETCWNRIFEISELLNKLHVKTLAIPNIEIVRKSEVVKHKIFDKILCNNNLCYNFFTSSGFNNTHYIGFSPGPIVEKYQKTNIINFLILGGMNPFHRKNIKEVIEAFNKLDPIISKEAFLTLTIQSIFISESELEYLNSQDLSNKKIIRDYLSHSDIDELYKNTDIVIQVSKQEGLGLGFYEPLKFGIPVITLDIPPHNEIIHSGINGWTIPAVYEKVMNDNPDSLYGSSRFEIEDLTNLISKIITNEICMISRDKVLEHFELNYSEKIFSERFDNILRK